MREVPGRAVPVNGRRVFVEASGQGCGRTCWDAVLPLPAERARLVACDRAGFGRSGRTGSQLSITDMAADLVAMAEVVVPGRFVLAETPGAGHLPAGQVDHDDIVARAVLSDSAKAIPAFPDIFAAAR